MVNSTTIDGEVLGLNLPRGLLTIGCMLIGCAVALMFALVVVLSDAPSADEVGLAAIFAIPMTLTLLFAGIGCIAWAWLFLDSSVRGPRGYLRAAGIGIAGTALCALLVSRLPWFPVSVGVTLVAALAGSVERRQRQPRRRGAVPRVETVSVAPTANRVPVVREEVDPSLASVGKRAGALAIDGVALFVGTSVITTLLGMILPLGHPTAGFVELTVTWGIALSYLTWAYAGVQSTGSRLMRVAVVDQRTGAAAGYIKGCVRAFVLTLYCFPALLGGLIDYLMSPPGQMEAGSSLLLGPLALVITGIACMIAADRVDRRTWHDRIAGTRVVRTDAAINN